MEHNTEIQVEALRHQQLQHWPLARTNYAGLRKVQTRSIGLDGCTFQVQFNPERVRSTTAKVDHQSIAQRPCFLCAQNRPPEQKAIAFGNFELLVNPFPIFDRHLTVPLTRHQPQVLAPSLPHLLELGKNLPSYIVFYNGPHCGASAPDHLHFQAIGKDSIPLFKWMENFGNTLFQHAGLTVCRVNHAAVKGLYFESANALMLEKALRTCLALLPVAANHPEPMVNVLATYTSGVYKVALLPRRKHRPSTYFAGGDAHFAISPASVDLGGVLVLPFQKDFERITEEILREALQEVSYTASQLDTLQHAFTLQLEHLFS